MTPIFARALGEATFAALPAPVRRLHQGGSFRGEATIDGPGTALARVCARLLRFPPPGTTVPLRLDIVADEHGESWTRHFGMHRMASRLQLSRHGHAIVERLGAFAVEMEASGTSEGMTLAVRRWSGLGIPLPPRAAPRGHAREATDNAGRFTFDIAVDLPFGLGRLVRYRGWLAPV